MRQQQVLQPWPCRDSAVRCQDERLPKWCGCRPSSGPRLPEVGRWDARWERALRCRPGEFVLDRGRAQEVGWRSRGCRRGPWAASQTVWRRDLAALRDWRGQQRSVPCPTSFARSEGLRAGRALAPTQAEESRACQPWFSSGRRAQKEVGSKGRQGRASECRTRRTWSGSVRLRFRTEDRSPWAASYPSAVAWGDPPPSTFARTLSNSASLV